MGLHGDLPPATAAALDNALGQSVENHARVAGVLGVAGGNGTPGGADDLLLLMVARLASMPCMSASLQVVTNSKRYFSRAAQCFTQEILTAADWYGIQQSSENRIYHK